MIRRLVNLKYNDGNSVAKHLSNFQGLLNELSTMKFERDDEVHTLLLLSSLPGSWETLVVSLSNLAPNGVITVNMVKDNMFNEETRRKELGISSNTEALVSKRQRRSKSRNKAGKSIFFFYHIYCTAKFSSLTKKKKSGHQALTIIQIIFHVASCHQMQIII